VSAGSTPYARARNAANRGRNAVRTPANSKEQRAASREGEKRGSWALERERSREEEKNDAQH
jgi:hypothetical protein